MNDAAEIEARLLARAGRGDGQAATVLVDRLGPKLMAFALRLTGGDRAAAEDIVQESFLRLWRRAGDWDPDGPARISTWLGRVASNLAIDRARRAAREVRLNDEAEDDLVDTRTVGPLAGLIARDDLAALRTALDALPPRQRQAVVLRHLGGQSNPDIAARMECGVEAVESLIARGKRTLTRMLRRQSGEPEDIG